MWHKKTYCDHSFLYKFIILFLACTNKISFYSSVYGYSICCYLSYKQCRSLLLDSMVQKLFLIIVSNRKSIKTKDILVLKASLTRLRIKHVTSSNTKWRRANNDHPVGENPFRIHVLRVTPSKHFIKKANEWLRIK